VEVQGELEPRAGRRVQYAYDAMGRPLSATQQWTGEQRVLASGAEYNPADQMVRFSHYYSQYTYQYNVRGQLVRERETLGSAVFMDFEYRYSTTANDGRIVQMKDWMSGEEVNYQYDELGRLIASATTGPQWGLSWTYDGFGNRLAQNVTKGTASVVSLSISASTNRIMSGGFAYDAAGNLVQWPGGTVTMGAEYDVDGRLSVVRWDGVERERYYYDSRNLRVAGGGSYQVYGLSGELLGEYRPVPNSTVPEMWLERVYFAGRLVATLNNYGWEASNTDRLGSRPVARRYPFGEGNNADNDEFATYRKDTTAQHYYAWHRFYSATWGRFSSPDPYVLSGGLTHPQGWNRYSYVGYDSVNRHDPTGLLTLILGGTFAGNPEWAQPGTAFHAAVSAFFGEEARVFLWSGGNSAPARLEAAEQLRQFIATYPFRPGEALNIVAHSHGGNVAKLFALSGTRKIDTLITLGTPHDFTILPGTVGNYFNVYSKHDRVQKHLGGTLSGIVFNIVAGAFAPHFPGGLFGAANWVFRMIGAVFGFFVSGVSRTDPCAINIGVDWAPGIGEVGHPDLHTASVWAEMLAWLRRAGYGTAPVNVNGGCVINAEPGIVREYDYAPVLEQP
jgi:RHS repeat-associated protein